MFQYRKRYGLHAIVRDRVAPYAPMSFNTASGMDCMQFMKYAYGCDDIHAVSIPQAVWIACNN